jgi:lysophospholipid acyltransferase (LPLAT)-like uncharacterized protein
VACSASRAWILKSWDRYIVPRPFARVVLLFGRPFSVETKADRAEMERARLRLQGEIVRLCHKADRLTGGPCRP